MKIVSGNPISIRCDGCLAPILDPAATICGEAVGMVKVLHARCAEQEYQFLTVSQARSLTLAALLAELTASVGL